MSNKTLLCRCEDVTLAEVEQAYDEGNRDIESLKRYTGFATGWCQGKQCLLACARFLKDRNGVMPDAPVTPRPPIHPVPLGVLAGLAPSDVQGDARDHERNPANDRGSHGGRS